MGVKWTDPMSYPKFDRLICEEAYFIMVNFAVKLIEILARAGYVLGWRLGKRWHD